MLQDLEDIRFFTDELPLDGDGDTAVMKADIVFGIKMEGYTSHRNCNGKVVKSEEWAGAANVGRSRARMLFEFPIPPGTILLSSPSQPLLSFQPLGLSSCSISIVS